MNTQNQSTKPEGMELVTYKIESLEKRFDKLEVEIKKAISELSNSLDTKYVTKERAENLNNEVKAIKDEVKSIKHWFAGIGTVIALTIVGAVMKLILK